MTDKEFKNEYMYQFMMHILRNMQEKGIINTADFEEAEEIMYVQYKPVIGRLFSLT